MSDPEERDKRSRKRKRNIMAKVLRDNKGPFAPQVINPKKNKYQRIKMKVKDINLNGDEDE